MNKEDILNNYGGMDGKVYTSINEMYDDIYLVMDLLVSIIEDERERIQNE